MKFICLHGAIGSSGNLKVQFWPVGKQLVADGSASFVYTQGKYRVNPPKGFEDYFGKGPWYRYLQDEGYAEHAMLARIRELPPADSPEDTIRCLRTADFQAKDPSPVFQQLDALFKEHPDAEGILGYSEGAAIAASYVLHEQRRFRAHGIPRKIKCGIFFTGWPAIADNGWPLFADEEDERIDIHSIHIVGANDPFLSGALCLYNVFAEDKAVLFDTGKGHTLPRDGPVLAELADAIRKMIQASRDEDRKKIEAAPEPNLLSGNVQAVVA